MSTFQNNQSRPASVLPILEKHGLESFVQEELALQENEDHPEAVVGLQRCEHDLKPQAESITSESANAQSVSSLMQLPPEIRLMIYRLLLKSPQPIRPRFDPTRKAGEEPYDQQVDLSSQLLRTCRKIYWEASEVLYQENTLIIYCSSWGHRLSTSHILDTSIEMPGDVLQTPADVSNLLSCAHTYGYKQYGSLNAVARDALINVWPSLLRFKLVHLILDQEYDEHIFIACRLLRELLVGRGRYITLSLVKASNEIPPTRRIKCLNWLRCSSAHIENMPDQAVSDVIRTVEGDSPVPDLLPLYFDLGVLLRDQFEEHFYAGVEPSIDSDGDDDDLEGLRTALFENDVERFLQTKNEVLITAVKWNKDWKERGVAKLDARRRKLIAELELEIAGVNLDAEDEIADLDRAEKKAARLAKSMMERTI
ncbi:Glycosylphosphatidylinositol (GPI) anchor assembly protein [Knufia obscura]|uniref:Glycosylphosphatidylinositol (GPI) anchor assembly protein n=2 Tax=Knufia TaxID=430999 RepID=A0AAN8EVZ5_9EURO|nr:Glycosylphosphatidylinositol (GPI) anchor assembly protein [Knufia obscura]KAK5953413.1 Glycosylphosphatidylinositol (GPI) anchor assembly protein [Knufia fluminis]